MDEKQIWQRLYAAAIAFRDLAPWEWMEDSDLFGVQNPETGEIGYCCIMGNAQQVFALGVYPGEAGLASYLSLAGFHNHLTDSDRLARGLNQVMLKAEFVDRREMRDRDLKQIKSLGLKFRGLKQWPQFREHRPSYEPWFLSPPQAIFLTHALEQACDVAERQLDDDGTIYREEDAMLVRVAEQRDGGLAWEDRFLNDYLRVEAARFPTIQPDLNKAKKANKRFKPAAQANLMFSFQYARGTWVGEDKLQAAYLARLALWLHEQSGMVLSSDIIGPEGSLDHLEDQLYMIIENIGALPEGIYVDSVMAAEAIFALAQELDIKVYMAPGHPTFREVLDFMLRGFGR